jgi:CheY-like chemotaxis protein
MKPLRILVVDDDATIGALLAEMLEDMGYVVCGVEATETGAVLAALRDLPDLMIVDVRLREGSGVAAMARIGRTIAIPHIFMSGARLPTGLERAVKLQKPFMSGDLVSAIKRATEAARADLP